MKEINSVSDAVPVIMEARGATYFPSRKIYRFPNQPKYTTRETAQAECCSLDVLAKEVWAKFPKCSTITFLIDDGKWTCTINWLRASSSYYEEYLSIGEAACIATARTLVALKERETKR